MPGSPFIFNVNEANDSQQMMQFNRHGSTGAARRQLAAAGDRRRRRRPVDRGGVCPRRRAVPLLDTNDDETISRVELAEAARPNPVGPPSTSPLAGMRTLMLPVDRGGAKTALVRKLIQLYDRTSRDPKTHIAGRDRKLSPKELGIAAAELARFDKNGDGAARRRRAGPLARRFDSAVRARRFARQKIARQTGRHRSPRSPGPTAGLSFARAPMEKPCCRSAPCRSSSGPPSRIREPPRTPPATRRSSNADRNANGYLEPDEIGFAGQGLGTTEFAAMDRDHNGMVFEDEFLDFMELRTRWLMTASASALPRRPPIPSTNSIPITTAG